MGRLILTCLIVHLQPLLVVVRLEHQLEHTIGHDALGPLALVLLRAVSKYVTE